jgi:hypothetical protein
LPAEHPLNQELRWLQERVGQVEWAGEEVRRRGHLLGLRILLHRGYDSAREITDADLRQVPELCPAEPDGVRERHHATVRPADLGADPAGVRHEGRVARATAQRDPPAGPRYSRVRRVSVSARSTGANDAE